MIPNSRIRQEDPSSNSDYQKFKNIGVIIFPFHKGSLTPLNNLLDILIPIKSQIQLITGSIEEVPFDFLKKKEQIDHYNLFHHGGQNPASRIIYYVISQIRLAILIFTMRKNTRTWIFFLGGENLVLPMIVAKFCNSKVLLTLGGSSAKMAEFSLDNSSYFLKILFFFTLQLSDMITISTLNQISEWGLTHYRHKILIAHERFVDFNNFTITTPIRNRSALISYVGRLSPEKGVQHFVQALPAILSHKKDVRVLIGGDGPLKESIAVSLKAQNLNTRVDLPGWISHETLPGYLNQTRLLVIPSYTEGGPIIMLEAMACGTPVLATPVGQVPDVIIDGETGFIMQDNSPECIAANVIRALNSPELEKIADNGRRFVNENFTFEKTVSNWESIFKRMGFIK